MKIDILISIKYGKINDIEYKEGCQSIIRSPLLIGSLNYYSVHSFLYAKNVDFERLILFLHCVSK